MTTSLPGLPIDIPLPPEVDRAFGYTSDARFVSFRWVFGDLWDDDGITAGSANGWVFRRYARHKAVAPLLSCHDLGGAHHEAPVMLLIDREKNRATIAKKSEAEAFLTEQWPPVPPPTGEEREEHRRVMDRILEQLESRPADHGASAREAEEQRRRVGRLMSWLDMCPVPGERGQTP